MIVYFFICLAATILGAISGIGGGVIIKPLMDAGSDLPVEVIHFLSSCTVLAMSIVSLLRSRRDDVKVEPKKSTFLALGAAAGGFAGKILFDIVKGFTANDGLVGTVQCAFMILLTIGVIIYMLHRDSIRTLCVKKFALCTLIGLILGILSSFLGIGGGPINIVVLYYFFSMDTKTATLNSIYVILFSQVAGLSGMLIQRNIPPFQWPIMISMVAGGILGGIMGRGLSRHMSAKQVRKIFYITLAANAVISAHNLIHFAELGDISRIF